VQPQLAQVGKLAYTGVVVLSMACPSAHGARLCREREPEREPSSPGFPFFLPGKYLSRPASTTDPPPLGKSCPNYLPHISPVKSRRNIPGIFLHRCWSIKPERVTIGRRNLYNDSTSEDGWCVRSPALATLRGPERGGLAIMVSSRYNGMALGDAPCSVASSCNPTGSRKGGLAILT